MYRTLFYIPNDPIAGLPIFGLGWLLLAWAVFSVVLLVRAVRRKGAKGEAWAYLPLLLVVGAVIGWVLPGVCEAQGLPIRGYGVMLLLAVAAAVGMAAFRGRRLGIHPEVIYTLAFWAFVPGIVGARLFYVIEYWPEFERQTLAETLGAIANVTQGGLVVYGSVIGGFLGLWGFAWKYRMPLLATLDLVAPSLALGMGIGRLGCFLNGCCFGGVCDLPWAVRFPADSPPYYHQVEHGETFVQGLKVVGLPGAKPVITEVEPGSPAERQGLRPGQQIVAIGSVPVRTVAEAQRGLMEAQQLDSEISVRVLGSPLPARWPVARPPAPSAPIHPTQIYSAIDGLVICLFLVAYAPFRRRDGEVWALLLTIYPITRFLMEILRSDEPGQWGTGLTIAQIVSLILLACAAALWVRIWWKPPGTAFPRYGNLGIKPQAS